MSNGIYSVYAALQSRTDALDMAANNLANAGTHGFRAQREYFRSVISPAEALDQPTASQVGRATNNYSVLGENRLDLTQGELESTGNPLDLALQGNGFFGIQTTQGTRYTRAGAFERNESGVLVTQHGDPVLSQSGAQIVMPNGQIHVSETGVVSVSGAQGSAIVGQIGIFDFGKTSLHSEGTSMFSAPEGATPASGTATVRQGVLEGSNQGVIAGTMQLILVQRQAEMMQKALSIFSNGFDKTAAEDLGRI